MQLPLPWFFLSSWFRASAEEHLRDGDARREARGGLVLGRGGHGRLSKVDRLALGVGGLHAAVGARALEGGHGSAPIMQEGADQGWLAAALTQSSPCSQIGPARTRHWLGPGRPRHTA